MGRADNDSGLQFLTVAQAADLLRINRMTLRSAAVRGMIPSKRDNEGRLRLDITHINRAGDTLHVPESAKLAPTEMIDILFDEVEELQSDLQERDEFVARLQEISERQSSAMDDADRALDEAERNQVRLSALLDRALLHLEAGAERQATFASLSEQSAHLLDAAGDRLEKSLRQSGQFENLLERAINIATDGSKGSGAEVEAMSIAVDRAMLLLDVAMSRAEQGQTTTRTASTLLEHALTTAERLEVQVQERDQRIERHGAAFDTVLSMSERAVVLAEKEKRPSRRGLFAWLFG
jgi:DNA repair exonuclease SbcCD ATPase subunit